MSNDTLQGGGLDADMSVVWVKKAGAGTPTITSNDNSVTVTDNGTGDYTITFGHAFLSAPAVTATIVDATYAATESHGVAITVVATNSVQLHTHTLLSGTGTGAAADLDFHMMAMGKRLR